MPPTDKPVGIKPTAPRFSVPWLLKKQGCGAKQASITLRMRTSFETRIRTFLSKVLRIRSYILACEVDSLQPEPGTGEGDSSDDELDEEAEYKLLDADTLDCKNDHKCTPTELEALEIHRPTHGVHFHLFLTAQRSWLNKSVGTWNCKSSVCEIFDFLSDNIDNEELWSILDTETETGERARYVHVLSVLEDDDHMRD